MSSELVSNQSVCWSWVVAVESVVLEGLCGEFISIWKDGALTVLQYRITELSGSEAVACRIRRKDGDEFKSIWNWECGTLKERCYSIQKNWTLKRNCYPTYAEDSLKLKRILYVCVCVCVLCRNFSGCGGLFVDGGVFVDGGLFVEGRLFVETYILTYILTYIFKLVHLYDLSLRFLLASVHL